MATQTTDQPGVRTPAITVIDIFRKFDLPKAQARAMLAYVEVVQIS
jgi:hypothetical protein